MTTRKGIAKKQSEQKVETSTAIAPRPPREDSSIGGGYAEIEMELENAFGLVKELEDRLSLFLKPERQMKGGVLAQNSEEVQSPLALRTFGLAARVRDLNDDLREVINRIDA